MCVRLGGGGLLAADNQKVGRKGREKKKGCGIKMGPRFVVSDPSHPAVLDNLHLIMLSL